MRKSEQPSEATMEAIADWRTVSLLPFLVIGLESVVGAGIFMATRPYWAAWPINIAALFIAYFALWIAASLNAAALGLALLALCTPIQDWPTRVLGLLGLVMNALAFVGAACAILWFCR
jgi:hypothetical protein